MSLINVQKLSNGALISGGKLYIGVYGSNEPEVNPITVYTDAALTAGIDISTGADLDQDGFPLINGVRTSLYVGVNFSLQIRDRNGASVWPLKAQQEIVPESVTGFDPTTIYNLENGVDISGTNYGQVISSAILPPLASVSYKLEGNGGSISVENASGLVSGSSASSFGYYDEVYTVNISTMNTSDQLLIQDAVLNESLAVLADGRVTIVKTAAGVTVKKEAVVSNGSDLTSLKMTMSDLGVSTFEIPFDVVIKPNLPVFADDAAAGVGGVLQDQEYKTSTGELRIKL